jgi:hypothetical protein
MTRGHEWGGAPSQTRFEWTRRYWPVRGCRCSNPPSRTSTTPGLTWGYVVFAGVGHEAVVFGGQGGVDAAGLAGGHEQCLPQDRVAAFGRTAVSIVEAGGVE